MKMKNKNPGIDVPFPTLTCSDVKCPFHGNLKLRGRIFKGIVTSAKAAKTVTVTWERVVPIKKFERFEKRKSKLHAYNPTCIDAKEGDIVRIAECRPLSKTKHFVVVEKISKQENFGNVKYEKIIKREKEEKTLSNNKKIPTKKLNQKN